MPFYDWSCEASTHAAPVLASTIEPRPQPRAPECEQCGAKMERDWHREARAHTPGSAWPFTTKDLSGKPETFNSQTELDRRCKELGVTHRPDNGWLTKEMVGVDWKTGKGKYKESSGVGLPGCWV